MRVEKKQLRKKDLNTAVVEEEKLTSAKVNK